MPCHLSFGSPAEVELRYRHFLEEIGLWKDLARVTSSELAPNQETAEAGRFRLTRDGRRVQLDVAVDARKYRALLENWSGREGWDWGDQ